MSAYLLTPLATIDIFNIWTYIAEHSEAAADRVEQAIYDACEFLAEGPLRGHTRPDLTLRPLRFWTLSRYPNYTLAYLPGSAPLQVIAVLHGKQNTRRILRQRR
ncbi:MAG: type II toxin-antitoxin system RelE/ParE family toxin [Acidobacteriaceae bacterium]|nr:type II toxin-antitoxin system RelE/ParE family toxin [Acidobacteriaceae bacterium]